MEYAILTPAPGAEHKPNTSYGPWSYLWLGEPKSIFDLKTGLPRPIPLEEAYHALNYFTPRALAEELPPLVEMEIREGELTLVERAPAKYVHPETGEEFDDLASLIASVKADAGAPKAGK